MSFLAPGSEAPAQEEQSSGYGKLKANPKARNRRGGVKFFDSADWAMKNGNEQKQEEQPTTVPYNAQITEGEAPADGESPLAGSNSPICG
ncbi:hypothetical protein TVAG_020080 [Trichomonas vaginalis G3]|uniref:Uncharacterized protein n=1 Tax=Trichomonas vaginalis (strain ATCC PRA-98 / G3) TaxID=412133 RepID=A2EPZ7_TRIV3|nr:hypothetical protein TVAGG3_0338520 [Trichomonas vaginalis G3]EAY05262.1 hypothetical protein TVAG_020080 [Trichomonas vaginalis G3]KAI5530457.1 hypothetical protein TVAGG3_0338520 [Trichomonas vaginalis G3]|eukprot:XP_001317485.1 hypothetical protein [Trichomonas vaginalis G3]